MSHQEKQKIFDQYAKSNGFDCWTGLQSACDPIILKRHIFRACDLVQEEQQKRIAVKAICVDLNDGECDIVLKDLITNPENLIS